ncbi:hypothetical protein [Metabacillus endolithicus]|uniref:Uncharacterized protein n=1 Tax=Metabacillus endolithicus TaxID=1535204 RepID=A0ABW5BQI2_9BACI
MNKEFHRRKKIADLSKDFSSITNGIFTIIKYKEQRSKDGRAMLLASIPLIEHPIYSETRIYIQEFYDEDDQIEYHYGWEKLNGSKHMKHISAWGNEHHSGYRKVKNTEPYHHHHVPEAPAERKDCYYIRELRDVLEFVSEFVLFKKPYNQDVNT